MEGESFEKVGESSVVANITPETGTGGLKYVQEGAASPEAEDMASIDFSPVGLPPTEDDPPGLASEAEKLQKLQAEQEELAKQKEELLRRERERLIREEKQHILQEKINDLFREFEALDMPDLESIFATGRNSNGGPWKSGALGLLDPEIVKSLAIAFKEGVKLLPQTLPGLLKQFDEQLNHEAEERVDQQLEEQKEEEKEVQENEASEPEEQTEMSAEEPPAEDVSDEPKVDETVST